MHEFVVEHDDYGPSRQLQTSIDPDGGQTALLHVVGPDPEPYTEALASVPSVLEWAVTDGRGDGFYVYARDALDDAGQGLLAAFDRPGLLVMRPVVYRTDGTIEVAVVGSTAVVQATLESLPDGTAADVVELGSYEAHRLETASSLTERQFAAVEAALACGHYQEPREGTVGDVADHLDCATSTAAEHLRRAEATVMRQLVTHGRL